MSAVDLDVDGVLADARAMAGLDDFGADDFREGLGVLLATYGANGYDAAALQGCRDRVVRLLAERLRIEAALARNPEIRDVPIVAPMYLTGLPRTGTSALLNLLAQDPAARPLKLWETMNPSPLPGNPPEDEDPRYLGIKAFTESVYEQNPDFEKIHHTSADTPEECIHLLNHTFRDVQFGVEVLMEPYATWFRRQDLRPSYSHYADQLRMLQWRAPGERLLLKSPAHLWALDLIVDLFPDCAVVVTHRNPVESVASYASMMDALMSGREHDRAALGPAVLDYLAAKTDRAMAARDALDPRRFFDLDFDDVGTDPGGCLRRIYSHFGIELTAAVEAACARHAGRHVRGEHGTHEYSLAEYGLDADEVLDRFAAYVERYSIAT
ncbi:MAG: sulfotransferase [Acidimicrobiia bacterium]|nr:sulfotransferase [Acidimicrobiia bacterium]